MENLTIAVLSALVAIIATVITMYKDAKKDTKRDAENNTSVREEIKYISRGVEDIKFDTKSIVSSMLSMNDRLIRAEESIKNAHEKIDGHIKKGE